MKKQKIIQVQVLKKESVHESFKDKFLKGKANFREDLDEEVEAWHEGTSPLSLQDFLGFTSKEYTDFLKDPDFLEETLKKERGF